jgi:DnaK suppressor protein
MNMQPTITITRDDLRRMLLERRRNLLREMQTKIRDVRAEAVGTSRQAHEPGDPSETDEADDLSFALLNMKSQVLNHINESLRRFDDGSYGYCDDCEGEIALPRLRALPFALRCKECEEQREFSAQRARAMARRTPGPAFDIRDRITH